MAESARRRPTPAVSRGASIEGLSIRFGSRLTIGDFDLVVKPGEFIGLLGPTGCRRSSLRDAIASFIARPHGRILVDGAPVQGPSAGRRMVLRQYAVFARKAVLRIAALGPRMLGMPRPQSRRRARDCSIVIHHESRRALEQQPGASI